MRPDLRFKDIALSYGPTTGDKAKAVRDAFRDHDLPACAVPGHTNIIHPDEGHRRASVERLTEIIRNARLLGTPFVISGTGTFDAEWMSGPRSRMEEGFETCREVIAERAQEACDHGAQSLIETRVDGVVGSVEETVRMVAQAGPPGLGLLMDPPNSFEDPTIDDRDRVLHEVFGTLADRIRIAHAKDVARSADTSEKRADIGDDDALASHAFRGVGAIALDAPGMGVPNDALSLERLSETHPDIPVVVEHLDGADVPRSKLVLDGKLRARALRPRLHGRASGAREGAARAGAPSAHGGVWLLALGSGGRAGRAAAEVRAGTALRLAVALDRAMDLAEVEHRSRSLGRHGPSGAP